MKLSREAIKRMIDGTGYSSASGSSSGGGGSYSQNFVSFDYWNQIFIVHGTQTVTVTDGTSGDVTTTTTAVTLPPNTVPSTVTETDDETGDVTVTTIAITEVEVSHDFYSVGASSALGSAAPGSGGGGSADLGALLTAMNTLTVPTSDGTYVLNVSGGTVTLTTETTGGGGTQLVTPLSLINGIGNPSNSGTYALKWNGTAYTWQSVATGGGITSVNLTGSGLITQAYISSGTTLELVASAIAATDLPDLSGTYALKSWVSSNFLTAESYTGTVTSVTLATTSTGLTITDPTVTGSGTIKINVATNYAIPSTTQINNWNSIVSNGITTLSPTDVSSGYVVTSLSKSGNTLTYNRRTVKQVLESSGATWWGQSMSSGVVKGGIFNASFIEFSEIDSSAEHGGYIDFHYNGSTSDYTSRIIEQGASGLLNINAALWAQYNGNVGIGNSSPSYKLDVNGNIRTTSDLLMTATNPAIRMGGQNIIDYNSNNSTLAIGYGIRSTGETYIEGGTVYLMGSDGSTTCARTGTATVNNSTGYGLWCENFMGVLNKFMFYYDESLGSVMVVKNDGQAVDFTSLGGNSALGVSSGSGNISSLTLGTLTTTGAATIGGALTASGNVSVSGTLSGVVSATTLQVGSGTTIAKIYWTGTQLRLTIGGNNYYFTPDN